MFKGRGLEPGQLLFNLIEVQLIYNVVFNIRCAAKRLSHTHTHMCICYFPLQFIAGQ